MPTKRKSQQKKKPKPRQGNNTVNPAINAAAKAIGSALGNIILPGIGGPIGSSIADRGHRLIKSVTGFGDYNVANNTLIGGDSVPLFSKRAKSLRVCNREYMQDVLSGPAGSFNIVIIRDINPSNAALFPWLHNIAQCYEEYKINGMLFEFKTTSSDAVSSTNTALGKVILATQYNPLSADFRNTKEMENHEYSSVIKPSDSILHPVECDPNQSVLQHLYVRHGDAEDMGDKRFYDFAKFTLAVAGMQAANVNIGELWITYDIEFFKPRLGTPPALMAHWATNNVDAPAGGSWGFASATEISNFSSLEVVLAIVAGQIKLTFPDTFYGHVKISMTKQSLTDSMSTTIAAPTLTGGASLYAYVGNNSANIYGPTTAVAGSYLAEEHYYTIAGTSTVTLQSYHGITAYSNTFCDLQIVLIPALAL